MTKNTECTPCQVSLTAGCSVHLLHFDKKIDKEFFPPIVLQPKKLTFLNHYIYWVIKSLLTYYLYLIMFFKIEIGLNYKQTYSLRKKIIWFIK